MRSTHVNNHRHFGSHFSFLWKSWSNFIWWYCRCYIARYCKLHRWNFYGDVIVNQTAPTIGTSTVAFHSSDRKCKMKLHSSQFGLSHRSESHKHTHIHSLSLKQMTLKYQKHFLIPFISKRGKKVENCFLMW